MDADLPTKTNRDSHSGAHFVRIANARTDCDGHFDYKWGSACHAKTRATIGADTQTDPGMQRVPTDVTVTGAAEYVILRRPRHQPDRAREQRHMD